MSDDQNNTTTIPLLSWAGLYAGGIVVFFLSISIANVLNAPIISIAVYFAIGFTLNRIILRRLSWHPLYNTISGVSKAKLGSFFLWPISYLILLFHLTVNKIL